MGAKQKTTYLNEEAISGRADYQVCLLLNFSNGRKGGFSIDPVFMWESNGYRTFKRVPFDNDKQLSYLHDLPVQVVPILKKVTNQSIVSSLVNGGFVYLKEADNPIALLEEKHYEQIQTLMYATVKELKPYVPLLYPIFHLLPGEKFSDQTVRPAGISAFTPAIYFVMRKKERQVSLECKVIINANQFPLHDFEVRGFFLRYKNEYFLLNEEDIPVLTRFASKAHTAPENELPEFLEKIVKPLAAVYEVDYGGLVRMKTIDTLPKGVVYLSELNENFLMIRPRWQYEHLEVQDEEAETIVEEGTTVYKIQRHIQAEKQLIEGIRQLHDRFKNQQNGFFHLSFKEALQKNWFLEFYNYLQQEEVPVFGMERLKKFKYNKHKPVLKLNAENSIDWFDLRIEVSYGDIVVPLQDLRNAILNKQPYILLKDGSMGLLPEEWINKYALLMQMANIKDNRLQVSRFNWTALEDIEATISDAVLREELAAHKSNLQMIGSGKQWDVPARIKAGLRDYQLAGFQWLCLLDEMKWGGCLADDMGLGKTLQTICFIQYLVEKYPEETHLVVCPTSLIYNWEAEIKKFAPGLSYYIHYGGNRGQDHQKFTDVQVVISSYGIVRGDIAHFGSYKFGYIILDESHAIKNPSSLIAKAIQQLQGRNRIAISGTPLQNNTLDLYSQMNFINPGMLGSQEFFKKSFANQIDKNNNAEKSAQLRKLVYPFMLRRTKEQVAKDLPDKTEMILWCEMGSEQRRIYDSYKEHYRQSILEQIAEQGIGKSNMFILEGLTKLRQICDSPALLNDGKEHPGHSTKLDELLREITENTGEHKVLVFSQFTSMLRLVQDALNEQQISFHYLDGSTPANERNELVQRFQENEHTRVFLISLKAGGVGLTLTAADYVYLIDPWWNPAAEQQAIDRTHRIGQQKKVFAYKMICKDSVEEKIIRLQEKKKNLAADIISEEAGFMKKLTAEDVEWLFA